METYTLDQVDKRIFELRDELHHLYDIKENLEVNNIDWRYKYIHDRDYGFMYVTNQSIDGDQVILRGVGFRYSKTDYRDDSYLVFDAFDQWIIPKNTFLNNSDINEITKDKFISNFKIAFSDSLKFGLDWINSLTNDNK